MRDGAEGLQAEMQEDESVACVPMREPDMLRGAPPKCNGNSPAKHLELRYTIQGSHNATPNRSELLAIGLHGQP